MKDYIITYDDGGFFDCRADNVRDAIIKCYEYCYNDTMDDDFHKLIAFIPIARIDLMVALYDNFVYPYSDGMQIKNIYTVGDTLWG